MKTKGIITYSSVLFHVEQIHVCPSKVCMYVCCSAQAGQHEPCKGECCPVWVLQQICWIFLATDMYEPNLHCTG